MAPASRRSVNCTRARSAGALMYSRPIAAPARVPHQLCRVDKAQAESHGLSCNEAYSCVQLLALLTPHQWGVAADHQTLVASIGGVQASGRSLPAVDGREDLAKIEARGHLDQAVDLAMFTSQSAR